MIPLAEKKRSDFEQKINKNEANNDNKATNRKEKLHYV